MKLSKVVTVDDLREAARRRLPRICFDFIDGGVEGERCLARNRAVFESYALLPRYLVDVSERDQRATLLGRTYDSPFGISPTGAAGLWRPGADDMLARVAAKANIPFALSAAASTSIEDGARIAGPNVWLQLYGTRRREISHQLIARAAELGVETLVLTVDVPVIPRRERSIRNGYSRPIRLRASNVIDGLRHPAWLAGYLRSGAGLPVMPNMQPYARPGASRNEVAELFATQTPAADQTWADLEDYRSRWPGKLLIKGVLHPDDAQRAADLGADGVIVSNHGGRQLDWAPSPLEVLPAIRAAVGEEFAVVLDSGVRRGTDVLVALCLGADFVFSGRSTLYGVAAFGEAGARRAVELLRTEIDLNLGQIGCVELADLGPHRLLGRSDRRPLIPVPVAEAAEVHHV